MRPISRGFTLIEIMVVMLIIAIIVTIGMVSADRLGEDDRAREERDRIQALLRLAADRAMIEGGEFGLHVSQKGYRFLMYREEGWLMSDRREFRFREWPEGIRAEMLMEGRPLELETFDEDESQPQVLLTGTGEMTPFRLILRKQGEIDGVVLEADPNGQFRRWHEADGPPRDDETDRRRRSGS